MNEGGHFTMDFIQEEYRDSVKMIMQILCVDIKTAYDLFMMSGCNVQAAIHLHTNPQPQHIVEPTFSRPNIPAGRGRRNGVIRNYHDYEQQLHQLSNHLDQDFAQDQYPSFPTARRRPVPARVEQQSQFDMKFNRFLQFKRKKKSFAKNYKIRRQSTTEESMSIGRKIFNKKPNKPSSKQLLELKPYINQVQDEVLQRRCHIAFGKGSMSQSLQLSFDKKKPLLVFHLNFDYNKKNEQGSKKSINMSQTTTRNKKKKMIIELSDDEPCQKSMSVQQIPSIQNKKGQKKSSKNNQFFKALLMDTKTVRLVNESFENYIVDCENYNYQTYFKEYFNQQNKRRNFLLILRVNVLEEIEQVGRVDLDQLIQKLNSQQKQKSQQKHQQQLQQSIKIIIQQLKRYLQRIKSIQKQQLQIHQRYRLLQMGIDHFQYIKPPTTAQKIKIKEDRQLIRQQQQQFMNIQNDMLQQQLKQQLQKQIVKENVNKITKEQLLKKRQQIRLSLRKYDSSTSGTSNDIMMIKFRLPNGKNIILNVSSKQTVQYLFDYIYSLEIENIGFEQQQQDGGYCERKFDIIRPQDRMNLNEKKQMLLEEVFEGSLMESLNVKQQ